MKRLVYIISTFLILVGMYGNVAVAKDEVWCATKNSVSWVDKNYCSEWDGKAFSSRNQADAEHKRLKGTSSGSTSTASSSTSSKVWCATKYRASYILRTACKNEAGKTFASKSQAEAEHKRLKGSSRLDTIWCATKYSVKWSSRYSCDNNKGKAFSKYSSAMAEHKRLKGGSSSSSSSASSSNKVWCATKYRASYILRTNCKNDAGKTFASKSQAEAEHKRLKGLSSSSSSSSSASSSSSSNSTASSSNKVWCATPLSATRRLESWCMDNGLIYYTESQAIAAHKRLKSGSYTNVYEKEELATAHYKAGQFVQALRLYREIAEAEEVGYEYTLYIVGQMIDQGQGTPKDDAEAHRWYKKALFHLRVPKIVRGAASWNLSTDFLQGNGVPKDEVTAYAYRIIAKTLGDKTAVSHFEEVDDYFYKYAESYYPKYIKAQGQALARQIWAKIEATKSGNSEGTAKKGGSTGSGFYINHQGHVITNSHVVNDCNRINVVGSAGKSSASIVIDDPRNDLALLKSGKRPSTIAYFRSGRGIRAGEDILAFGFPLQSILSDELKVTKGMVNALSGFNNDSRMMQISAPVQPGNSGGPLLDQAGNVVGVVTSKMDAVKVAKYTGDIPQNVNFALKASLVRDMLEVKDIDYETESSKRELSTVDIVDKAKRFSVLIECFQ